MLPMIALLVIVMMVHQLWISIYMDLIAVSIYLGKLLVVVEYINLTEDIFTVVTLRIASGMVLVYCIEGVLRTMEGGTMTI
jgi:hypothetical protein